MADRKPRALPELSADMPELDLVDRVFEYLQAEIPALDPGQLESLKAAMRAEFRGERVYIRQPQTERQRLVAAVLSRFNGRNASEVARELSIGRATVYRILKQAGE
jgi:Mor family transcriptional regulator